MKVGILTMPVGHNYGGALQALALAEKLKQLGCSPIVLSRKPHSPPLLRLAMFVLESLPFQDIRSIRTKRKKSDANRHVLKTREIEFSPILKTSRQLRQYCVDQGLDAVVVGSDQVWRMSYVDDGYYDDYFLNFLRGTKIRCFSYAASFGTEKWERPDLQNAVSGYLRRFSGISVREESGKKIVHELFCVDCVERVLDPTLLFDKLYYQKSLVRGSGESDSQSLAVYCLDESEGFTHALGIVKGLLALSAVELVQRSPNIISWVSSIYYSTCVLTDSFHGMVFSIIFEKEFFIIKNDKRGKERFNSLLEALDVTPVDSYEVSAGETLEHYRPCYPKLRDRLSDERRASSLWLEKNLRF